MRANGWRMVAGLGALTLLAGCATAPVALVVDSTLSAVEVYPVDGALSPRWDEPLRFGGFSAAPTHEGVGRLAPPWLFDGPGLEGGDPYRFVFVAEDGGSWEVECLTRSAVPASAAMSPGTLPVRSHARLACEMRGPQGEVDSLLLVGSRRQFRGEAKVDGQAIEILPLRRVTDDRGREHQVADLAGYELRQDGRVVGSVDVLGDRVVYLASGLAPELRGSVAMTSSILLLFGAS